jgi:hypothetical protein
MSENPQLLPSSLGSTSYDYMDRALHLALKNFFPEVKTSEFETDSSGRLTTAGREQRDEYLKTLGTLKVGLFGYVTDVFADVVQTGVFHRNALLEEVFLNTAKLSRTIFNHAKISGYDVGFATPARLLVNFSVKKSDAIKLSASNTDGTKQIVIDRTQSFTVGSMEFMLPRDVRVLFAPVFGVDPNSLDTLWAVTAQWVKEEDQTLSSKRGIPDPPGQFLRNFTSKNDKGEDIINIEMPLYQMSRGIRRFNVYSTDMEKNLIYSVEHTGQLAQFDVYYEHGALGRRLLHKQFNDLFRPEGVTEWAYYTPRSDDVFDIYFSALPDSFRPRINSTLEIEFFTTLGQKGNFDVFEAPINYRFPSGGLSKLNCIIAAIGSSSGGKDALPTRELKQEIVNYNLTRDSLISQQDVNNFFNKISQENAVNGSKFLFIKKRDDVLRRVFTSYALIRDSSPMKRVVPTNTFDLETDITQLRDSMGWVIKAGTPVIYDDFSFPGQPPRYRFLFPGIDPVDGYIYALPYMMVFRVDPFPRITYYKNMVSDDYSMPFSFLNSRFRGEIIASPLHVQRDSSQDLTYDLSFTMNTAKISDADLDALVVRGVLTSGEGSTKEIYGYFDFIPDRQADNTILWAASLQTNDTFQPSSYRMAINNSLKVAGGNADGTVMSTVYVPQDVRLEIAVLSDSGSVVDDSSAQKGPYEGIDESMMNAFQLMDDMEFYSAACIFRVEGLSLFTSMADVMLSDIVINPVNYVINIKNVPGIGLPYYLAATTNGEALNYNDLYKVLARFENMLSSNKQYLENNAELDLKFYNTWGPSERFSTGSSSIKISLRIKIVGTLTSVTSKVIKERITQLVEAANNDGVEQTRRFAFSNMARVIENEFENVAYVEFISINGQPAQTVLADSVDFDKLTKEQLISYVPAYLNVAMKPESYAADDRNYEPDINIEYF